MEMDKRIWKSKLTEGKWKSRWINTSTCRLTRHRFRYASLGRSESHCNVDTLSDLSFERECAKKKCTYLFSMLIDVTCWDYLAFLLVHWVLSLKLMLKTLSCSPFPCHGVVVKSWIDRQKLDTCFKSWTKNSLKQGMQSLIVFGSLAGSITFEVFPPRSKILKQFVSEEWDPERDCYHCKDKDSIHKSPRIISSH